jgi:hypothetical protein
MKKDKEEKRSGSKSATRSGSTKFSSSKLVRTNEFHSIKEPSKFEKSKNVRNKIGGLLTLDTVINQKYEFTS